jgi:hypothetical protein
LFLQEFAAAYRELREEDPAAWEAEAGEVRAWDATLQDGLAGEDAA